VRLFIQKEDIVAVDHLVQGINRHPVGASKVPHRRVSTRQTHLDHCLVVFVKETCGGPLENGAPEVEGRQALHPEGEISCDDFRLWGAV
jgi:hypothetical protein